MGFHWRSYLTHGETITIDHDDGVSLYINNVLLPGFTANSTPPDVEHEIYYGPTGVQSFSLVYGEDDGPPAVLTSNLTNVPEPSTWAMMLLGFAALGFAGYRKAKKHTRLSLAD